MQTRRSIALALPVVLLLAVPPAAQTPRIPANYDESKVPPYVLPDPLVMADGTKVLDANTWTTRRRPELLSQFASEMFGKTPGPPPPMQVTVDEEGAPAFDGRAVRRQITLRFGAAAKALAAHVLLYLPAKATSPVPVFLALNFQGNQAVAADPKIALATSWLPDSDKGVVDHHATDGARGTEATRFPISLILSRGYGLVTAYYGDFDPDFDDGFQNGVQPLFYRAGQSRPGDEEWGAIGAWAWGLSRIVDALESDQMIDQSRVVVVGHSRLGKAALWAGAQDTRFAAVVSNESGCGGAALSKRIFGETVGSITAMFPHWFAIRFRQYADHEDRLPFDQHELLALVAPRPLYVASAAEDQWADPRGEFLAARAADPVYRLFGKAGIGTDTMPPIGQPVGDAVRYHVRPGKHDLTEYDWEQFLAFADRSLAH
jgi:hypothetical protein